MRDIRCVRCGIVGSVSRERIISGLHDELEYTCGRCQHVWRAPDGKSAHDLVVAEPPHDFTVSKLQGGYTRYLPAWKSFRPGAGVGMSAGFVLETLQSVYGSRANVGLAVYLTLRPAATTHVVGSTPSPPVDHSHHVMPQPTEPPVAPGQPQ